ncbi:unnamed protein product [Allacma fusca]|uniref:E3 SUMO-protein ligase NSE2 n=1 Tax=Allacma fusca TaxID=39272 RepID=A0A8J2MBC8_9HEXA|nr:unnamed protein product [Allacma fusca]
MRIKMPRGRAPVVDPDNEADVEDQVTESIQFGRETILQLGKDILPICGKDLTRWRPHSLLFTESYKNKQEDVTNRLTQAYKKLIKVGIVYNKCSSIVKEVAKEFEDNDANQANILKACDNIEMHSRERVMAFGAEITDDQICKDRLYTELMDTLKDALDEPSRSSAFDPQPDEMETEVEESGDESEVDVDSEATIAIVTKDPLTKKEIKNPVKNKICNHIYDEKTILNYMKSQHNNVICPYAGCTNKTVLKKDHFEHDEQLVKKVSKKQKGQRRRRRY